MSLEEAKQYDQDMGASDRNTTKDSWEEVSKKFYSELKRDGHISVFEWLEKNYYPPHKK